MEYANMAAIIIKPHLLFYVGFALGVSAVGYSIGVQASNIYGYIESKLEGSLHAGSLELIKHGLPVFFLLFAIYFNGHLVENKYINTRLEIEGQFKAYQLAGGLISKKPVAAFYNGNRIEIKSVNLSSFDAEVGTNGVSLTLPIKFIDLQKNPGPFVTTWLDFVLIWLPVALLVGMAKWGHVYAESLRQKSS